MLRPPLVYGPGAPGRFALLLRLVRGGWPLPAAGLPAGRSVIFIDNLLDATELALEHPAATGRCFALCDATAPSTEEWGRALGRQSDFETLLSDRCIDHGEICELLGWQLRVPFVQAMALSLGRRAA